MLCFSATQVAAFASAQAATVEARLLARLQRAFSGRAEAAATAGGFAIQAFIRHGIERAKLYGISSERDVALYIALMVAWGARFDETTADPNKLAMLRDLTTPAHLRLDALMRRPAG